VVRTCGMRRCVSDAPRPFSAAPRCCVEAHPTIVAPLTIEKFVDTDSIDPVYYDTAYFIAPDGDAGRDVYAVLREAVAKTGKTALARVVIAQLSESKQSSKRFRL